MDDSARLAIERACERVVIQLTRAIDDKDFEGALQFYTDDAVWVRRGREIAGKAEIAAAFAARPPDQVTRHFLTNMLVDVDGPAAARVASIVTVVRHRWGEKPPEPVAPLEPVDTVGEFVDFLVLTADGWRIKRRETREYFERG